MHVWLIGSSEADHAITGNEENSVVNLSDYRDSETTEVRAAA